MSIDKPLTELEVHKSSRLTCKRCSAVERKTEEGRVYRIRQTKVTCPHCGSTFCPSSDGRHHKVKVFDSLSDALLWKEYYSKPSADWPDGIDHFVVRNVFGVDRFMCLKD